jgi:hypothetical protein
VTRRARGAWRPLAVAFVAVLGAAPPGLAQRPAEEAIVPPAEYKAAAGRVLAEAHLSELRLLYDDVRRCAPELDFNRQGLGFRRPIGSERPEPYLAIWVWLPRDPAPTGADIGARAADAFRRYGPRLLPLLARREPIQADSRVGGNGLVLTWIKPPATDPPIGETLIIFAPKAATAAMAEGTLSTNAWLAQARMRAFDGQTEVTVPRFTVDDAPSPSTAPC